jgi:hypothetical protein
MMIAMLRPGHHGKIFKAVIKLITVDVMDALRRIEFSTKMIFHYKSVLSSAAILAGHHIVATSECSCTVWSSLKDVWVTIPLQSFSMFVAQIFRNRSVRAPIYFANSSDDSVTKSFSFHPFLLAIRTANRQA